MTYSPVSSLSSVVFCVWHSELDGTAGPTPKVCIKHTAVGGNAPLVLSSGTESAARSRSRSWSRSCALPSMQLFAGMQPSLSPDTGGFGVKSLIHVSPRITALSADACSSVHRVAHCRRRRQASSTLAPMSRWSRHTRGMTFQPVLPSPPRRRVRACCRAFLRDEFCIFGVVGGCDTAFKDARVVAMISSLLVGSGNTPASYLGFPPDRGRSANRKAAYVVAGGNAGGTAIALFSFWHEKKDLGECIPPRCGARGGT